MAKAFGILLIVLGVWLGVEIFTNGMDGAFGGIFAPLGVSAAREPAEPPMQKIRSRVQESMKAGAARSTNGIDDAADDGSDDSLDRDDVDLDAIDQ